MLRVGRRVWGFAFLVSLSVLVGQKQSGAVSLDKDGTMKLGMRSYVNARVGTERTDETAVFATDDMGRPTTTKLLDNRTFPSSGAGHLRQNRFFIEAEFDHDLGALRKQGFGPLALLDSLPFRLRGLKYHLVFRGEYDGIYDWGPVEYSTAVQFKDLGPNVATNGQLDIQKARQRLRKYGSDRERLFQAYVEGSAGDLFVRVGRQILSWGETDGFRLLDNINPIDSSFGGFLISLDERRVPLDMLRLQYSLGNYGPISEAFIEAYGAVDNKVGFSPGTPAGSPWTLPNSGEPSRTTKSFIDRPRRNFTDMRGGLRGVWNMFDGTFSLAHYWTYVDTPGVTVRVRHGFPATPPDLCGNAFIYDMDCKEALPGTTYEAFSAEAIQSAPLVQISGASATFAIPQIYSIFRSEFAYFNGEPRFRQSELDPFMFHFTKRGNNFTGVDTSGDPATLTGGRRIGDSINFVMGLDINQYIRFLNPNQTFFITTQFFYKHLIGVGETRESAENRIPWDGEVLPVGEYYTYVKQLGFTRFGAVEPNFIRQPADQFLHTLLFSTSYFSGQVNPSFLFFYDWGGAFVYQPSVTFSRDPFRFAIDYSILDAGRLKGGSGVSLLRDRDNIQFRIEYVI